MEGEKVEKVECVKWGKEFDDDLWKILAESYSNDKYTLDDAMHDIKVLIHKEIYLKS